MTAVMSVRRSGRHALRTVEVQLSIAIVVAVLLVGAVNPRFLGYPSLVNVLVSASFVGVLALAETLVLLCGELDLSVGAVAAFAGVVSGQLMVATQNVLLGLLAALGVGAAFGLLNAGATLGLRLPSFIATIGSLYIASGLAVFVTGGNPVYPLPKPLTDFGTASLGGFTWMLLLFLLIAAALEAVTRFTAGGRSVFATGGDSAVAVIAGIRVTVVKATVFVACAVIAAFAGFLQASVAAVAQPTTGVGAELAAVTAAVIGGVSIFGGKGSVAGATLGAVFLSVVVTGLPSTGLGANWQNFATGVILIVAIGLDVLRGRRAGLV